MKVYLSGAITNNPDWIQQFNEAAERVAVSGPGYCVINPVTIGRQVEKANLSPTYADYMRADLVQLMQCDFIYYVNDISGSRGAQVEKQVAEALDIKELQL